jgi:hypothetical protein
MQVLLVFDSPFSESNEAVQQISYGVIYCCLAIVEAVILYRIYLLYPYLKSTVLNENRSSSGSAMPDLLFFPSKPIVELQVLVHVLAGPAFIIFAPTVMVFALEGAVSDQSFFSLIIVYYLCTDILISCYIAVVAAISYIYVRTSIIQQSARRRYKRLLVVIAAANSAQFALFNVLRIALNQRAFDLFIDIAVSVVLLTLTWLCAYGRSNILSALAGASERQAQGQAGLSPNPLQAARSAEVYRNVTRTLVLIVVLFCWVIADTTVIALSFGHKRTWSSPFYERPVQVHKGLAPSIWAYVISMFFIQANYFVPAPMPASELPFPFAQLGPSGSVVASSQSGAAQVSPARAPGSQSQSQSQSQSARSQQAWAQTPDDISAARGSGSKTAPSSPHKKASNGAARRRSSSSSPSRLKSFAQRAVSGISSGAIHGGGGGGVVDVTVGDVEMQESTGNPVSYI